MALITDTLELAELTTAQRDALAPNIATLIYNTTIGKVQVWNGAWIDLPVDVSTITSDIADNVTAIALNTAKVGITPTQAADILTNNAKVSGGLYGTEYNYVESEAESSTTSTSYVNKVTLTTSSLVGGNYRISVNALVKMNASNKTGHLEVNLDSGTILMENNVSNDVYGQKGMIVSRVNLSAGVHTIDINYSIMGSAATITIKEARIELIRVS